MAEGLSELTGQLNRVSESVESVHSATQNAHISLTKLAFAFAGAEIPRELTRIITGATGLSAAWRGTQVPTRELLSNLRSLESQKAELQSIADGLIESDELSVEEAKEQLALVEAQLPLQNRLLDVSTAYNKLLAGRNVIAGTLIGLWKQQFEINADISRQLIQANSALEHRRTLTKQVLEAQGATGVSMRNAVDAAQALVSAGLELNGNFQENLRFVIRMHEGLGVAHESAVELAQVFQQQLNTSVERVADGIARVANDTALAADEAARLASNLGRAIATLRPGMRADLGAVTELVGRYEGILKQIGGTPGAFTELLTKMTSPEGLMQAGLLGVGSPEFIGSENATKQVLKGFASYAKSFLGDTAGWERALRLQSLGEQFGVTAQQANLMLMAIDKGNDAQATTITLEERFNQQMRAAGENIGRMTNSLVSLLRQAVQPFVFTIVPLTQWLANLAKILAESRVAVTTLTVSLGAVALVTLPAFVREVYVLGRALILAAAAARAAAIATQQKAAADAAATATGIAGTAGGGVAGLGQQLMRFLPSLRLTIGGLLVATITAFYKRSVDAWTAAMDQHDRSRGQLQSQIRSYKDSFEHRIFEASRTGDMTGIKEALAIQQQHLVNVQKLDAISAQAAVARLAQTIPEIVGRARFTAESAVHTLGPSDRQTKHLEVLKDTQKQALRYAEEQTEKAKQMIVENRIAENRAARDEKIKQMREQLDRLRNPMKYVDYSTPMF